MPRMGDVTQSFVDKCINVARQYPEILPRGLDVEEFDKDRMLYDQLATIRVRLNNMGQKVEDTLAVCGSEAFLASLTVYGAAKANGQGLGMDTELEEMGKRFRRYPTASTKKKS